MKKKVLEPPSWKMKSCLVIKTSKENTAVVSKFPRAIIEKKLNAVWLKIISSLISRKLKMNSGKIKSALKKVKIRFIETIIYIFSIELPKDFENKLEAYQKQREQEEKEAKEAAAAANIQATVEEPQEEETEEEEKSETTEVKTEDDNKKIEERFVEKRSINFINFNRDNFVFELD